jgi:signal transduction histidine kinase
MADKTDNCSGGFGQIGALTKLMNVGVLLLGPAGNLEFANTLACELLSFDSSDALKGDWERVRPLLKLDSALHGATKQRSFKVSFAQGDEPRLLRLEIYALDEESCSGHLILLRDRRIVHVLENDLLLASQMRAQNYLYGALMHDLRAPLNALEITVELLVETLRGGAAPTGEMAPERYARVLREELSRLNRTLRTVLDSGAPLNPEFKDFDLVSALQEIEALLAPQARRQRITLQLQVPPDRLVLVRGQRDSIKQALLNVAINGLEAMPTGGSLSIQLEVRDDLAQILFSDSGPGVPEDILDEIYQVYFTTKKSGSGMGLYVARLVLESHGGDIHVENRADCGACFCLTLPLAKRAPST